MRYNYFFTAGTDRPGIAFGDTDSTFDAAGAIQDGLSGPEGDRPPGAEQHTGTAADTLSF